MESNKELPYSNTPIYLPAFLAQYGKKVKDMRDVNWTGDINYQMPFLADAVELEGSPEIIDFPFMGKNCWLWKEEYCLLEPVLDRVVELTIIRNQHLGVGPLQPIWDHSKSWEELEEEGITDMEQDLISATFRCYAVLTN